MHLSKSVLYVGIIAYSVALLLFQDWPAMTGTLGLISAAFLAKMGLDILFASMAGIRLVGPAFFADDENPEDDVAIHAEDLQFSDTALFGLFFVNVLANGGFHAYKTVTTLGGESFAFSLWVIVEFFALFLTFILWRHAVQSQRRKAARARAARAAGPTPVPSRDVA